MDSSTFQDSMETLQEHFGKKLRQPKFYWDELKHLPSDAFEDIVKNRIKFYSPNPGQFPTIQALLDDWQMWLKKHPHRQEIIHYEHCQYCEENDPGHIKVKIPLTKPIYAQNEHNYRRTMVRCGHCQNAQYRNPTWPRYRREDIEGKGWIVVTKEHELPDEEVQPFVTPTDARSPGMKHIEHSLPKGDRDEDDSDLPF